MRVRILYSGAFVAMAALEFTRIGRVAGVVTSPVARRSISRLRVTTAGAALWPALVLIYYEGSSRPVVFAGGLLVLLYLLEETRVIGNFYGKVHDFETMDRFDHRASTIGTFLFAMGTLIHTQSLGHVADDVTPAIYTSLALCCFASITFSSEKRTISPHYAAMQKMILSYSAGFLCLAVMQCIRGPT